MLVLLNYKKIPNLLKINYDISKLEEICYRLPVYTNKKDIINDYGFATFTTLGFKNQTLKCIPIFNSCILNHQKLSKTLLL